MVAFWGYKFKTLSGLPFTYKLKKGRGDEFTKELWIDRREGARALLGVPCCWRITISVKSER